MSTSIGIGDRVKVHLHGLGVGVVKDGNYYSKLDGAAIAYQVLTRRGLVWVKGYYLTKICQHWGNLNECENCSLRFSCFTEGD